MASSPLLPLNDDHTMPALGFGTYSIDDVETIVEAVEAGYRLLDTAARYENETEVGRAVAQAPVPRDELFVTTKLPGADHGRDRPRAALEASLERLGLDRVDLYLIHWPLPHRGLFVQTWEAFVELRDAGLTRSIGVSNFLPEHLDAIMAATGVPPAVNQVELHPYLPQERQRAADAALGTVTQSWSPLGRKTELLAEPVVTTVAERHDATPAQVVLAWHLAVGAAPIPKSATPERFRANLGAVDLRLSDDDLAELATLDRDLRIGGDPADHEEL